MYTGIKKYPLFLLDFNDAWIFSIDFRKSWRINFYENPPVGAESFHADGRTDGHTDMMELAVVFRNFADAPNNQLQFQLSE
jgi:hypothetical protein